MMSTSCSYNVLNLTYWRHTQNFFHFHLPTQIHIIIMKTYLMMMKKKKKYFPSSHFDHKSLVRKEWGSTRSRRNLACEAVKIYFDWWDFTYESEREDEGLWTFSRTFYFSSISSVCVCVCRRRFFFVANWQRSPF